MCTRRQDLCDVLLDIFDQKLLSSCQGSKYFIGYDGYCEQNLPKVTLDYYLLKETYYVKLGASHPQA